MKGSESLESTTESQQKPSKKQFAVFCVICFIVAILFAVIKSEIRKTGHSDVGFWVFGMPMMVFGVLWVLSNLFRAVASLVTTGSLTGRRRYHDDASFGSTSWDD